MFWMRTLVLGLGLACLATATAEDKKDEKKPLDPAKLVGKWSITEGMKAGEKTGEDAKKGVIEITKDKISLKSMDMEFEFIYKVDVKADPVTIDLEITKPEGFKGSKAPGIIKLEDGKFTLCYSPMGGDRPKKFESTKDNGNYMFTMKAAAKEEKK
jgi:uncharacterized protein (TIGR03067 family)